MGYTMSPLAGLGWSIDFLMSLGEATDYSPRR